MKATVCQTDHWYWESCRCGAGVDLWSVSKPGTETPGRRNPPPPRLSFSTASPLFGANFPRKFCNLHWQPRTCARLRCCQDTARGAACCQSETSQPSDGSELQIVPAQLSVIAGVSMHWTVWTVDTQTIGMLNKCSTSFFEFIYSLLFIIIWCQ